MFCDVSKLGLGQEGGRVATELANRLKAMETEVTDIMQQGRRLEDDYALNQAQVKENERQQQVVEAQRLQQVAADEKERLAAATLATEAAQA